MTYPLIIKIRFVHTSFDVTTHVNKLYDNFNPTILNYTEHVANHTSNIFNYLDNFFNSVTVKMCILMFIISFMLFYTPYKIGVSKYRELVVKCTKKEDTRETGLNTEESVSVSGKRKFKSDSELKAQLENRLKRMKREPKNPPSNFTVAPTDLRYYPSFIFDENDRHAKKLNELLIAKSTMVIPAHRLVNNEKHWGFLHRGVIGTPLLGNETGVKYEHLSVGFKPEILHLIERKELFTRGEEPCLMEYSGSNPCYCKLRPFQDMVSTEPL